MSLNNLKISRKLIVAFALLIITSAVSSGLVLWKHGVVNEAVARAALSNALKATVNEAYAALAEQQAAFRGFAISGDANRLEEFRSYGATFDENIARFREQTLLPDGQQRADQLIALVAEWRQTLETTVPLINNPATRPQGAQAAAAARLGPMREATAGIMAAQGQLIARRQVEQESALNEADLVLIVGGAATALMALIMGWLLARSIATPVSQMTETMGRLAGGDNEVTIPGVGRKDEIGAMAEAVQGFKDAAIEKLRLEAEAAKQRAEAEAERARNEAAQRAAAEEQATVVRALASGLSSLAKGDLTCRLNQVFPGEYKKLQDDFNAAMSQMMETMRVIAQASHGIRSGAGEVSQAADDLSRRTEQQAASLEETAAALDEISSTVKQAAAGSQQAHDAVATARQDAEQSGEVMRGAVSAMQEIENSAQQISRIIGVIDEIAFQTNLLALNAGVEAARAGEAGRGFAVVASEVRALAQRSAEAAKEIKALISTSTQQVESGVRLVGSAGEALSRIISRVTEINGLVSSIAVSAQEQASGLSQVSTAVNQMDQTTQQNAAMVEESTAASHSLAHEADELTSLIARFDIGEGAAQPARTRRAA